ncbi:hypothetical protein PENTCL1PPCAC_14470, partial [Pristionchus entomophagus]
QMYSYTTTGCSVICNSFLIFVIVFTDLKHVGAYRWLLFSFSIVDILISINHTWMFPAAHMTEFGYIFWGYRLLDKSTAVGVMGTLLWCFLFYQSFVLLAFHYVYRYIILVKYVQVYCMFSFSPPWLIFLRANPWRNWITIAVISDLVYGFSICGAIAIGWPPTEASRGAFAPALKEAYGIDLYSDNLPGYLCLTYWV